MAFHKPCIRHGLLAVLAAALLLSACKPKYPANERPTLHTTISADGKMVATLLHAGTQKQRLRILRLDSNAGWEEITAPPLTRTIHFGLQGHQLLLTHSIPGSELDQLVRLDLGNPALPPQVLYQAPNLGFPLELRPGQVMVRVLDSGRPSKALVGYHWLLIDADGNSQVVSPKGLQGWPQPVVINDGYFWVEPKILPSEGEHPKVHTYPLPGGLHPEINPATLPKNTWDLLCDHKGKRCLRDFISNLGKGTFIYSVEVRLGSTHCEVEGVSGTGDGLKITPSGNAAVMSLASAYDQPRHVVVMHFTPGQCQPVSVKHIDIDNTRVGEEKVP